MATAANTAAWQAHAEQRLAAGPPEPLTPPPRMQWTQHPGAGPGAEILGDLAGRRVVELGCGPAHNLAHLVSHHDAIGVGVDAAPAQIERARAHYGHLARLPFVTADATAFLTATGFTFDVCYCVFGALGLTPPDPLLAAIGQRLRPGGRLAFSVQHRTGRSLDQSHQPVLDTLALPYGQHMPITRWTPGVSAWVDLLDRHGFAVDGLNTPAPDNTSAGSNCLVITAHHT